MERNVHTTKPCTNERNASHNSRRNVLLRELFTKANIMLISLQANNNDGGTTQASNVYSLRRNAEKTSEKL